MLCLQKRLGDGVNGDPSGSPSPARLSLLKLTIRHFLFLPACVAVLVLNFPHACKTDNFPNRCAGYNYSAPRMHEGNF